MSAKEYLNSQIETYNTMKKKYEAKAKVLDNYILDIEKLLKGHDENSINYMKDVGIDLWLHIGLMRKDLSNMKILSELTMLKYKREAVREGRDKWDVVDDVKYLERTTFSDITIYESELEWIGRLFTILQGEIKQLIGDKRSAEYLSA